MLEGLEKTSQEFSKFVSVDTNEKLRPLNKSIDDMLARLEEFQTMVFFAKQERLGATNLLDTINSCNPDLKDMFSRIDSVEVLVEHVKNNLESLEQDIEKAENEMGYSESTTSKVANIFTPLFKKQQGKKQSLEPAPPFKTSDYFD